MAKQPQLLGYTTLLGDPVPTKWERVKQALWETNLNAPVRGVYNLMNTPYETLMGAPSPEFDQAVADSFDAASGVMIADQFVPRPSNSIGMGGKPIKGYHGSPEENITQFRASKKKPAFFAVDDGTPRPQEYANSYKGESGKTYEVNIEGANVLDARTPEGRAALVSALDKTYPLGGEFYLWEKGVPEGNLPGWGDDMLFRSVGDAGHSGVLLNERPNVVSAAIVDDKVVSIVRKYGIAGASALLGYNVMQGANKAQASELEKANAVYHGSNLGGGGW